MTPEAGARFVLGLQAGCTAEDVKKAFRRLALIFHPDKNPGKNAEEAKTKFQAIVKAKDVLLDCREIKEGKGSSASHARGNARRETWSQSGASRKPSTGPSSTPQKEPTEAEPEPSPRPRPGKSFGLFAAWVCGGCEMHDMCRSPGATSSYAPCSRAKPSTNCFCGHPFEMHSSTNGGKLRCMQIGCLCGQFSYVPAGAVCTCGHSSTEHDAVPFHACEVPGCSCPTFHSAGMCACGHNWACHRTDIRTRTFANFCRRNVPTAPDPEESDASSSSSSPEPPRRRPSSSATKPPDTAAPRRRPSSANIFGRRCPTDGETPSSASKPPTAQPPPSSTNTGEDGRPTLRRPSSAHARAGSTPTPKQPPVISQTSSAPPFPLHPRRFGNLRSYSFCTPPNRASSTPAKASRAPARHSTGGSNVAPPVPVTIPVNLRKRPCSAPPTRSPAAPNSAPTASASETKHRQANMVSSNPVNSSSHTQPTPPPPPPPPHPQPRQARTTPVNSSSNTPTPPPPPPHPQPRQARNSAGPQTKDRSDSCKEASPWPAKTWGHSETSATVSESSSSQTQKQPHQAKTSVDIPPEATSSQSKPPTDEAKTSVRPPEVQASQSKPPTDKMQYVEAKASVRPPEVQASQSRPPPDKTQSVEAKASVRPPEVQASQDKPPPDKTQYVEAKASVRPPEVQASQSKPSLDKTQYVEAKASAQPPEVQASQSKSPLDKTQYVDPSAKTAVETPPRAAQSKPAPRESENEKPPVAPTPTAPRSNGRSASRGPCGKKPRPKSRPSSAVPLGKTMSGSTVFGRPSSADPLGQPSQANMRDPENIASNNSAAKSEPAPAHDSSQRPSTGSGQRRGLAKSRPPSRSAAYLNKGADSVSKAAEAAVAAAREGDGLRWWERLHTCGKVRPHMSASQPSSHGRSRTATPSGRTFHTSSGFGERSDIFSPFAMPEYSATDTQRCSNTSPSTPIVRRQPTASRMHTSSLKEDSFIYNDDDDASPDPEYFGIDSDEEGEAAWLGNAPRTPSRNFEDFAPANSGARPPRPTSRPTRPRSAPSCTSAHDQWTHETLSRLQREQNIPCPGEPDSVAASHQAEEARAIAFATLQAVQSHYQSVTKARPVGSGIAAVAAMSSSLRGERLRDIEVEEEILRKVDLAL